jgi:microcystin degradation protein MlrC
VALARDRRAGPRNTLIATIADARAIATLKASGAKRGDPFDMAVGGMVDESAGEPVRIQGKVGHVVQERGQLFVAIEFGRGNVLVLSPFLVQIMKPDHLKPLALDLARFDALAIKSRVHFRRGFDIPASPRRSCRSSPTSRSSAPCGWTGCRTRTSTSAGSIPTATRPFREPSLPKLKKR